MTKDQARAIATALALNNTLTSIDLGDNDIGDQGGIAIAKALEENSTLISINLSHNEIGDEGR